MSDIAVVGLGALFPGAPDVRTFWDNISTGRDCIAELPETRSDPRYYDPASSAIDRLPTRRGGFVGEAVRFEAGRFGIMPVAALGAEPDQMLALQVAAAALDDAGGVGDGERAGVIVGRGGYLTPGMLRLHRKVKEAEQLVAILRDVVPGVSDTQLAEVKARFQQGAGHVGPDTAIGLVPNLTASRIANRLDLKGPAYTVDAACASALIAVEHAVRELRAGRCDRVVAGGVHLTHEEGFWSVFSQLGALSRSGTIRPFDRRADGLLVGEGIGMLVLERLDDALRAGRRVYAVIAGVGSASDGRASSVMVPRVDGQVLALQRAWEDAGLDRERLGLIEAHGTATAAGDRAELTTLRQVFGAHGAVIGSVKSQIGHAMPAAGAAGLIKAVLAVYHGVLPPSIHCEEPHELLADSPWEVLARARPWDGDRVAGVNAFGFGGINAHVVVRGEGLAQAVPQRARRPADRPDVGVLLLAAESPEALLDAIDRGQLRGGEGPCRLAVLDPTPERVRKARDIVARWKPWTGRRGIWFRPHGLLHDGGLVFQFPGIEASFAPQVDALARLFGREVPAHMAPEDLEQTGRGVIGLGRFLFDILHDDLGLEPDMVCGHSIGEWTAMIAAGAVDGAQVDGLLDEVPVGTLEVAGVLFAACACGREQAEAHIADLPDIAVSHDNCPHQILLCGEEASIRTARERLVADGVVCQILPFRSGFHSPLFRESAGPHRAALEALTLRAPERVLYSATLAEPFPSDPHTMRDVAVEHLVAPLRWRELLEHQYEAGGRVFVQVGTGSLPHFAKDTFGERRHHALSVLAPGQDGVVGLRNLLLALFVEGLDVPLDRFVPADGGVSVLLPLGTPLLSIEGVTLGSADQVPDNVPHEMRDALHHTLASLRRGPVDVVAALNQRRTAVDRLALSVDAQPYLVDHCLFPQPPGWPHVADAHPVVPMTMTLELLQQIASELAPDQVPVEIAEVELQRWIPVCPPLEVERRARREGGWVRAEIVGYASARIRFATAWPAAQPVLPDLERPAPPPVDARQLYTDGWMFHGPAYQGVTEIGALDDTGIDGVITVPSGQGALLDNAGQLLGYWLMATTTEDRLAMPIGLGSVQLFGPAPEVGTAMVCRVRITEVDARGVTGDVELLHGRTGQLWCRITRWADHRFKTGPRVWRSMRRPGEAVVSLSHGPVWVFDDQAVRAPSRDWLARRYLSAAEREELEQSRRPRQVLNQRIVAKDAVRSLLWDAGAGPLYPVQTPREGLHVATAASGQLAVAIAGRTPVGIGLDADPEAAMRQARAGLPEGHAAADAGTVALGELTAAWVR